MRPVKRLALLSALLVVACAPRPLVTLPDANGGDDPADAGGGPDAGPVCGCEQWGNPRNLGAIEAPLVELSGLVASRTQPGIFFAHNDSGDGPRFFALSSEGRVLETYELPGATAVDWEELTVMPCAAGSCLVIGDFGDNRRARTDYALYVVAEPVVGQGGTRNVSFEKVPFEYPGGVKHNAEAMFAHPVSGRVYVVTKPDVGQSEVFRFPAPLPTAGTAVLERVAGLTVPAASDRPLTGAAVNPCGTAVLLRLYNRLVELRLPEGEADFERIFTVEPVTVPSAQEPQGEAVTYGADGRSYFTASEKLVDPPPLYGHLCR